MGRFKPQATAIATTTTPTAPVGGGRFATMVVPKLPPVAPNPLGNGTIDQPPVKVMDVVKGLPQAALDTGNAFAETFIPAITNFFKTSGGVLGEGLAYAVDPIVREQYGKGNLDILPTVTNTTIPKMAKATIAAGIETAVYRNIPAALKGTIVQRGGIGALQGVGFAIAEGLANDKDPEDIVTNMAAYGVPSAVIGIVAPYLIPVLGAELRAMPAGIKKLFGGIQKAEQPAVKLAVQGAEEANRIPIRTPNTRYEAYLKSQGYEPYVANDKLPTIEMGKPAKSDLPTLQLEKKIEAPTPAGTRLVPEPEVTPIADDIAPAPEVTPAPKTEPIQVDEIVPETRVTPVSRDALPTAVKEGETRVSGLEARMKGSLDNVSAERAEAAGLNTYKQMNKAEQIKSAAKYVDESPDDAMAVLRGEKSAPEGLLHNSIALALEKRAESAADANLAIKLASLRSTRAGQEISILTEADPSNPISHINEIIKARAARTARKFKEPAKEVQKTVSEGTKEMTQAQVQIHEAEKLLDELTC